MSIDYNEKERKKMKQEKGRTFTSFSKSVKSTRSKLKQTAITTPIKNAPLTAKVNSTWNNVLNKNKVVTLAFNRPKKTHFHYFYGVLNLKGCTIGKISNSNKFEINLATNDPMKTLSLLIIELKNKVDTLLPGMMANNQVSLFGLTSSHFN